MKQRVAIASSLTPGTGNETTAKRIGEFLNSLYEVSVVDSNKYESSEDFLARAEPFDLFLGVHLLRSALNISDTWEKPSLFVLGGTDINEAVLNSAKLERMQRVVAQTSLIVCFTDSMRIKFRRFFPSFPEAHIAVVWPSVRVNPVPFNVAKELSLSANSEFILLPTGIRAVKDPSFLIDIIESRAKETLLICGPILSESCFAELQNKLIGKRFTRFVGILKQNQVHHLMTLCKCVVNCSLSEGLANSLLEAFSLKCPVLVRDIEGNSFVDERYRFKSAEEFGVKLNLIHLVDRSSIAPLSDWESEKQMYLRLVKTAINQ